MLDEPPVVMEPDDDEPLVVMEPDDDEPLVVVEPDDDEPLVVVPDAGTEAGRPGFVGTWAFPEAAAPWLVGDEGRPALDDAVPDVLEEEAVPPPVAARPVQKAVIDSPLAFAAATRLANATEPLARELTVPVAVVAAPPCTAA